MKGFWSVMKDYLISSENKIYLCHKSYPFKDNSPFHHIFVLQRFEWGWADTEKEFRNDRKNSSDTTEQEQAFCKYTLGMCN